MVPESMPKVTNGPKTARLPGLKKRQQIEAANKSMFVWIVIAAIAVSFCVASGQFLLSKWSYNNKVYNKKQVALNTLNSNLSNVDELKRSVDALVADEGLTLVKTNANDPNTKSVLDALPTSFDSSALATSLQQVILSRSGVKIDSLSLPADADQTAQENAGSLDPSAASYAGGLLGETSVAQEISFSVSVTGSYDKIMSLADDFGKSIRPFKIVNLSIEGSDVELKAAFEVVTYYQPGKDVTIIEEVVR